MSLHTRCLGFGYGLAVFAALLFAGSSLTFAEDKATPPKAEPAQPKAEPAQPKAEKAQPKAEKAQPKAEKAQAKPEPAQSKDEKVQPKAEKAQAKPEPAQPKDEKAQPKAEPAQPKVEPAQPKAEPAQPKVEPAQVEEEPAQPTVPEDPDFPLQGEFVGSVRVSGSKLQLIGLQVRPMSGGFFEGIQYQGGLPGQGARQGSSAVLVGKRAKDFLLLSGGPWLVYVEPDHCVVTDRQGRHLGRLERVCRESPTLGVMPPKEAIVLFDGTSTEQFVNGRVTDDGLLMEGSDINPMFQDFNLHAEFLLPYVPAARDQNRGNSGLYLQSRYELQVLDSFATEPVFNGCGSMYRQRTPDLNMCLPPLTWQTYDVMFTSPRWAANGTKLKNARITVWLNGVKIHNNVELPEKTGAGKDESPTLLPIRLQDHKNPVRYRNIWIVDRGAVQAGEFPVYTKDQAKAVPEKPEQKKPEQNVAEEKKPEEKKAEEKKPEQKKAEEKKAEQKVAEEKKAEEKKPEEKKAEAKKPEPAKPVATQPATAEKAEKPAEQPAKQAPPVKEAPQKSNAPQEKPASQKKEEASAKETPQDKKAL